MMGEMGKWIRVIAQTAIACMTIPVMAADIAFRVAGYEIVGDSTNLSDTRIKEILAPYVGEKQSLSSLQQAAEALELAIKKSGNAFYGVSLPPQKPEKGIIKLEVTAYKLASLKVKPGKFFSEDNIKRSLPVLKEDQSPDIKQMQRNLYILNQHPSKQTAVAFSPSLEQIGKIDAEIKVQETDPQQMYMSMTNTGSEQTGKIRLSTGYQHNNLFGKDHALTLSYTTSPGHWGDVQQKGAFYKIPLYDWGSSLTAYYTESSTNTGEISGFAVSGSGRFGGLKWEYALPRYNGVEQALTFGIDEKDFINNVTFIQFNTQLGVDISARPWNVAYKAKWQDSRYKVEALLGYRRNIAAGKNNNDTTYNASRAGADSAWNAWTYSLNTTATLDNKWEVIARLSGQNTDEALIAGEQFGIGGSGSVRGAGERVLSGDKGMQMNLEVWMPATKNPRLFGFFDAGTVSLVEPVPGTDDKQSISSAGFGVQWLWKQNLSVNATWGKVLDGDGVVDTGDSKWHLNLFYKF